MPQCLLSCLFTRSSTATLFNCPPAPPEGGKPTVLLLELRLESLELPSDLSLPPSSSTCLLATGDLAPVSGTCLPPGTMTSTATLFDCPPPPPGVSEPPLLLLELRLESLELMSYLSLPPSSSIC